MPASAGHRGGESRQLLLYFALAFGITWGIGGVCLFVPSIVKAFSRWPAETNPLFYAAVYAPTLSAVVVTAVSGGTVGLRELLGRLSPWRAGIGWYVLVLIGYPAVGLLAGRAAGLAGAPQGCAANWPYLYPALVPALVVDPGPLGEELGWRGFALPRMLRRWTPITATVVLGVVWGLWHLPAFFIAGLPQARWAIPALLLGTVSVSVLDTWIFLRTRGGVLLPLLVHLMMNHAFKSLCLSPAVAVVIGVVSAAAVLLGGGLRPRAESRSEPRMSEDTAREMSR
jgi:uncharacterized protein